jgi:hypothetical protein
VDGSAYEQASTMFTSQKSRAEVVAELKATPRLPGHIDGSAYEMAHDMFMSRRSRDEVRAEAANFDRVSAAALIDIQGGRN